MTPASQQRPQPPEEHPTVFYALQLAVRSDVIVPSIQITGWSPVALSANGKRA